jgi:hypothetical protein
MNRHHRHSRSRPHGSTYVEADGKLAERLCHVELLNLTEARARELVSIHAEHHPDNCAVHLACAVLLCGR